MSETIDDQTHVQRLDARRVVPATQTRGAAYQPIAERRTKRQSARQRDLAEQKRARQTAAAVTPADSDDDDDDTIHERLAPAWTQLDEQTVRPAAKSDFIESLPERESDYARDSAVEFQAAFKPPYAPAQPAIVIDQTRRWYQLEIYDQRVLLSLDWYDFLLEVIGLSGRPPAEFFLIQTPTAAGTAARAGEQREPTLAPDTLTGALSQFGLAATQTPARQFREVARRPAGADLLAELEAGLRPARPAPTVGESLADLEAAARGSLRTERATESERGPPEASRGGSAARPNLNEALMRAVTDVVRRSETLAQTGARKAPPALDENKYLRDELVRLHGESQFQRDEEARLSDLRRVLRQASAQAAPWIERPLATGTFQLNPSYVAAKRAAHGFIGRLVGGNTTSLSGVPVEEYVRRRPDEPDAVWLTVRSAFANLVAQVYLLSRYGSGVGLRHVHDYNQIVAQANGALAYLYWRVGYDRARNTFYQVSERNDERTQASFMRLSQQRDDPFRSVLGTDYDGAHSAAPSLLDIRALLPRGSVAIVRRC